MYARIATFEGGDIEKLRERLRGSHPRVEGVTRVTILRRLDGDIARYLTFFGTREDLEQEEAKFVRTGDTVPEEIRGRRLSIDHYEVVFDESGSDAWEAW